MEYFDDATQAMVTQAIEERRLFTSDEWDIIHAAYSGDALGFLQFAMWDKSRPIKQN